MDNRKYLEDWLKNLREILKKNKDEIEEMEKHKQYNERLGKVQSSVISKWLNEEGLTTDVRTELEDTLTYILNRDSDDKKKLEQLNSDKEVTEFMINKIEKELD